MESKTAHFKGETVVWRGPWHQEVPLDFHILLAPGADPELMHQAAMVLSRFLSEEWVSEKELEYRESSILDEDEEG